MENPHTPTEMAELSTLVHNVAGWLFLLLALAYLVETVRGVPAGRTRYVWPGIGAVIGFGLTVFVFLHQTLYHAVSPFADPAQLQHQIIGLFTGAGAAMEVIARRKKSAGKLWRSGWPLGLVGVGIAFLIHEQGTAEALLVHWALAATLILAGLGLFAVVLAGEQNRALVLFSTFLLIGAALQLVVFEEKPGAHGAHGAAESAPPAAPAHGQAHGGH